MTDRNRTPTGSTRSIGGSIGAMIGDGVDSIVNTATEAYNFITGNSDVGENTFSADVPGTAEEQMVENEARVERKPNPIDNLLFNVNGSLEINNLRNQRHEAVLVENKFAVRLRSIQNGDLVVFRISPEISETRSAAYKTLDPVHMPGAIQVYQNTAPRTWNVSGIKLVSRNGEEAEENLATVNQLRSWMMPFFGKTNTSGNRDGYVADLLGSPPEILEFTAYSSQAEKGMTNIRKIPTIMTTMNLNYPTDVDYIKTAKTNQPFPAVTTVDIILVETHSPKQLSQFDLIDYRHGELEGF